MKNKFLLISAAMLFCLTSCKKNAENSAPAENDQKVQETGLHQDFTCEMKVPVHTGPQTDANGPANQLWTNGSTIKVKFIGGSTYVRSKVKQYAKTWETSANITFSFVADNAAADIKIAFANDGSWSYVGKESKNYSPSMNYGWFNDSTSDTEFRRTVTHEFGHALGLNHEQSHPDANIPWNTQAVYAYYMGPPNNWSKADVDFNVLAVESRTGLNYTAYDSSSIMHYPVEARFTTNNRTIAANNTTISAKDVLYMKTYYPWKKLMGRS
ncbi:M12 family metallopeptidase [Pedobacter sp. WC2423]|uniref:M12 family metallopeptidase n=1 Tax=Pedobacter sp. WC2423 TaxID=3234142 RepID=UPI0034679F0A